MTQMTILCIDDDSAVLSSLRTLLSRHATPGTVVELAENGVEALEMADDLRRNGDTLAVVIADYIMPGMRGDQLLISLHERYPNAIKIMLTGQSDLNGVKRAINEANLYRFLEKPFNNADLVMTVNGALSAFGRLRELELECARLRAENQALLARLPPQRVVG
ncbi:response regulator [Roseateles oligotrophus]|uniref:Response regulator n=1 Tax=Roseateles oligotrophus TaxID=1769250 RepID=A0ABT2YGG8_9BURK|nr:response regulator [Roseateles oligotrophus]MCV2369091.1 response regulator [Roseateles oligotrophus]